MKQKITFLLLTIFTLVLSAQTVSIEGGSSYGTIQEAIDASIDSDVILISGIFTESISIEKSITLRGTDPVTDIIQAAASASSDGSGSRVISLSPPENTDILTITIENLGIRHGNASSGNNGGGINSDKIMGLLTLNNLIIKDNYTASNGGGIGLAGTNANIVNCTIMNNTSNLDGGGIIAAPNNNSGNGIDGVINIKHTLLDTNSGRNGGGIYINGNNNFGNDYKIDVNFENSTISNNTTKSASGGNGGGGVFCTSFPLTSNTSVGNTTLKIIHVTSYNNFHAAANKSGFQFAGTSTTNFSAFNSIVVSFGDDVATKALNFANTNTTDVVNCILGGLNAAPALVDDAGKNNQKGRTSNEAGLTGTLSDEGGNTQVIAITESSVADDYCTASTGISIPTIDQRGFTREGVQDAGAFEVGGTLSTDSFTGQNISVRVFPNPASEIINISGFQTIKAVKVYSLLGTLEKVVHDKNEFDVSTLSSGIHMMVIEGDGLKINKRLIIK